MSTIAEIEAAMEHLPRPEQENLLAYLIQKLRNRPPATNAAPKARRETWLRQLDRLRERGAALSQRGTPLQDVFDDLRAEPRS